ncbi:MAG: hypothetical protein PHV07_08530 [Oscillospiraceae bacterium]|nr:hypothetical protein [Oscillospiraceae bacterium]
MKKTFIGAVAVFAGLGMFYVLGTTYFGPLGLVPMALGAFILVKEYFSKD